MSDLLEQLQKVRDDIYSLKILEGKIENTIFESNLTFKEKFGVWIDSPNKKYLRYLPDKERYPFTYEYFKRQDLDRNRLIDLGEYFEDAIGGYLEEEPDFIEMREDIRQVLIECMEKNLGSFSWSW